MHLTLGSVFTDPQMTAIGGGIDTVNTNFPFAQNLDADDKKKFPTFDNERRPYVEKAIVSLAPIHTNIVVPGMPLATVQSEWKVYNQFEVVIPRVMLLLSAMIDTQHRAGNHCNTFMRQLYDVAKLAEQNNVPGAEQVINELKGAFEGQGNFGDTPGGVDTGTTPA